MTSPFVCGDAYRAEASELDAEIVEAIAACRSAGRMMPESEFNSLALRILAHQLAYNAPYARFCASLGVTPQNLPRRWDEIPPVPVSAFKDAILTTFPPQNAELHFETSGTTRTRCGTHLMENAQLYRASLLAGFDDAILDDRAKLRYFNVLPRFEEAPRSSLAYMLDVVTKARGDGSDGWYVHGEQVASELFVADLHLAIADYVPVCITGTAFGLLNLIDALDECNERFVLPSRSRIMETGGFKGRTREIQRSEFYRLLCERFRIDDSAIVAEYGMTELASQAYDSKASRNSQERIKISPPWMRSRVVDVNGHTVGAGALGALVHVDLANRSSVIAVATDDVGYHAGEGFVLRGRADDAELRGCSLDAEELWSRVR
ncbi:MAG: hypothetical protein JO177_04375 [Candidatus Eremiobacteraeota bacterium]|nr:hypothetical protein [Candidatus Eremiobacteraeota bacterium]